MIDIEANDYDMSEDTGFSSDERGSNAVAEGISKF